MTITLAEVETLTARWPVIHAPPSADFLDLIVKHTGLALKSMDAWTQIGVLAPYRGDGDHILRLRVRKGFRRMPIVAYALERQGKWTVRIIPKGTL